MASEPTSAEVAAGAEALERRSGDSAVVPGPHRSIATVVLAAVLPDHDARREAEIRADERRKVAEAIWAAEQAGATVGDPLDPHRSGWMRGMQHARDIAQGDTDGE